VKGVSASSTGISSPGLQRSHLREEDIRLGEGVRAGVGGRAAAREAR